jgi:hypothetical protein
MRASPRGRFTGKCGTRPKGDADSRHPGQRAGRQQPDCLAIGTRPVPADDPDPGVRAQPFLNGVCGPAGDDINTPARLRIDEDSRVDQAAAQREVVDPQDPGDLEKGKRDPEQRPQGRVPGCPDSQRGQQPGSSRAEARPANSRATAASWAVIRAVRRW